MRFIKNIITKVKQFKCSHKLFKYTKTFREVDKSSYYPSRAMVVNRIDTYCGMCDKLLETKKND